MCRVMNVKVRGQVVGVGFICVQGLISSLAANTSACWASWFTDPASDTSEGRGQRSVLVHDLGLIGNCFQFHFKSFAGGWRGTFISRP